MPNTNENAPQTTTTGNTDDGQIVQSTVEWALEKANEQYEAWMPWLEDTFLKYFTKDNRGSYAARDQLEKTKITGIKQVDAIQDNVNDLAASSLGQGGILEPVGDIASEGMKRSEQQQQKQGKGDQGQKPVEVPAVSALGVL